jgi:diacylglycerol kinase
MNTAIQQRPRLYALLRRWPTALGVGVAALTLSDFDDGREFAIVLLIASIGYLAIAVLERPEATWWVLIGLLAGVVCMRLLNIAPEPVLVVAAVAMTIVGLVRGSLRLRCKYRPPSCSEPLPSSLSRPAPKLAARSLRWVCLGIPFGMSFTFAHRRSCHRR